MTQTLLRLGHATVAAHVGHVEGCGSGLLRRAEFQHSVVYYATEQRRKRPEAFINAEGGHSEHLL